MLSYSLSLRQVQIIYLKPSKNTAHQWMLDCLCTPQWSFYCELPLTLTDITYFFQSYFHGRFLSLRRFSSVTAVAKLSTLFKNLSNHLHRTVPGVSMVLSVDWLRGLVKPLKQWERLIHEVRASYSCRHVNCYRCKQRILSWNLSLTFGLDICYTRLVPVPACECDVHFPSWTRFGYPPYVCFLDMRSYPRPPLPAFLLSTKIYWVPTTCQTPCQMYRIQW